MTRMWKLIWICAAAAVPGFAIVPFETFAAPEPAPGLALSQRVLRRMSRDRSERLQGLDQRTDLRGHRQPSRHNCRKPDRHPREAPHEDAEHRTPTE